MPSPHPARTNEPTAQAAPTACERGRRDPPRNALSSISRASRA
jgi:hypothetical protein